MKGGNGKKGGNKTKKRKQGLKSEGNNEFKAEKEVRKQLCEQGLSLPRMLD